MQHPPLQAGIISATLPFPGTRPHGYLINVMIQGGASGSPVFLSDSGTVIGAVYSSRQHVDRRIKDEADKPPHPGPLPQVARERESKSCPSIRSAGQLATVCRREYKLPGFNLRKRSRKTSLHNAIGQSPG
jgi:hypothetical protein